MGQPRPSQTVPVKSSSAKSCCLLYPCTVLEKKDSQAKIFELRCAFSFLGYFGLLQWRHFFSPKGFQKSKQLRTCTKPTAQLLKEINPRPDKCEASLHTVTWRKANLRIEGLFFYFSPQAIHSMSQCQEVSQCQGPQPALCKPSYASLTRAGVQHYFP